MNENKYYDGSDIKVSNNNLPLIGAKDFKQKVKSGNYRYVIAFNEQEFQVEIMEESRNRTIFKNAKIGDLINLERAAKIGDRNSGHFVLGHIDTTGEIIAREKKSDFELFRIKISRDFADLIVFKGSIAVDGISLTISDLGEDWFEVSIISSQFISLKGTEIIFFTSSVR
jgi:riboflavin synthase alpha subunit